MIHTRDVSRDTWYDDTGTVEVVMPHSIIRERSNPDRGSRISLQEALDILGEPDLTSLHYGLDVLNGREQLSIIQEAHYK